ncbi:MAG: hypothetical protein IKQ91_11110, partial [Oscillospiraceae bacterium]|nr:hypothetical protein [Oscillospiraceae bacterium]
TAAPGEGTTVAPSETTAPIVIPEGTVGWVIGQKTVAAGAAAKVPVTIKNDPGSAGFVVSFTFDPKLTFTGVELGNAYPGMAKATVNENELIVVWADDKGENQKADEDAVVLYLNFTAPQETGEYPVKFSDLKVSDTEGEFLNTIQINGAVNVVPNPETEQPGDGTTAAPGEGTTAAPGEGTTAAPGEGTTAAPDEGTTAAPGEGTTAPNQTTAPNGETQPAVEHHAVYQIADVNGQAGKSVDVPVYVLHDEGTTGFTMQFKVPEGYKITGCKAGDAYQIADNEYKWNADEAILVWAAQSGEAQTAKSGSVIAILTVDIPAGTEDGTVIPVEFVKVTVSGSNEEMVQHDEKNGSITVKNDAGDIVFNIGSNSGKAGDTVDVPLIIGFGKGVSSFEIQLDVPDGLTIDDLKIDPDSVYAQNGTFTWDPETKTLKWTSNNGDIVADPNTKIADIQIKIPEGAEAGTVYDIKGNATATNKDGNSLTPHVTVGKVTVEETPDGLKVVTDIAIDYTAPTRVNYWSHDDRTFKESGGLNDMKAIMTLKKYYINADNQFVDAEGNVISETKYDAASGVIPAGVKAFSEEQMDVTQYCHPISTQIGDLAPENTPAQVWENQLKAEYGDAYISPEAATTKELRDARLTQEAEAKTLKNKHTLDIYYFSDENPNVDFRIGDPYRLGDYNIFIGVKGDTSLDNKIGLDDVQIALKYYTQVMGQLEDVYMVNDDEYGHVDELRFFLGNVKYAGDTGTEPETPGKPKNLGLDDVQMLLKFYTYRMGQHEPTWQDVVGYDRLDTFYPGSMPE